MPHERDGFFNFGKLFLVGRSFLRQLLFVRFEFGIEVTVRSDEEFGRRRGVEGGGEEFDVVQEFGGGDAAFVFALGYVIEADVGNGVFLTVAGVDGGGGGFGF